MELNKHNNQMTIYFDVKELYYLPQYLPIFHQLIERGYDKTVFVFHHGKFDDQIRKIIESNGLISKWVQNDTEAKDLYIHQKPNWIFFGNSFPFLREIHDYSKTAQLGHGVGPKSSYYSKSSTPNTVRFVEGEYRKIKLESMFPDDKFIDTGFSKLDPILTGSSERIDIQKIGLTNKKKTILYAPTFYPSSIEKFPEKFPKIFNEFNIIIKPHFFTHSKQKYSNQRKRLKIWGQYENVFVASPEAFSLVPFLAVADIMISDASSAVLEFAALGKPVIVCKFLKLRWNYRGIFSFRFKKRMSSDFNFYSNFAFTADNFSEILSHFNSLPTFQYSLEQKKFITKMIGSLDGKASKRIVDYLEENL